MADSAVQRGGVHLLLGKETEAQRSSTLHEETAMSTPRPLDSAKPPGSEPFFPALVNERGDPFMAFKRDERDGMAYPVMHVPGASTRDVLAAIAMLGFLSGNLKLTVQGIPVERDATIVARLSYEQADAMLKERGKE